MALDVTSTTIASTATLHAAGVALALAPVPVMDQYRNLAYGIIEVAPAPPLYGTTVRVRTARPTLWPPPPFNATVWPINTMPTHANAEIVRVTGVAGPVLTFLRAQEGTTEKALMVGDQIANTVTKKLLDDLRSSAGSGGPTGIFHHETHEPGGEDELVALDATHLKHGSGPVELMAAGGIVFGASGDGDLVAPVAQWNITGDGDLLPWSDKVYDIGSPDAYVRHLYVQSATVGSIAGGLPSHQATHQKGAADEILNVAWTNQANVFTAGIQTISAAGNPQLRFIDTNQPADATVFRIMNQAGGLTVSAISDSNTVQSIPLTIDRLGTVTVPNLIVNGVFPQVRLRGTGVVLISFRDLGGAVDAKNFRIWNNGGTAFVFDALNDAETVAMATPLTLARNGNATVAGTLTARQFVSTANSNNLADLTCGPTNFTQGVTVTAGGSSFAAKIDVTGGSGTGYNVAPIEVRMVSYPRIAFHWPGVVAAQLGMDNYGTITAYDNPGTNYANFRALGIYAVGGFYGPKPPRTLALGAGTNVNPDCALYDMYCWDAINVSASIQNPVNVFEGFNLIIRFRDQGASCPIYWGSAWTSHCASPLPAATVAPAKTTWCAFRYNSYYGQWHMLSVTTEP